MTSGQEMFLWGLAIFLILIFPVMEVARKTTTHKTTAPLNRNAAIVSVLGIMMALWLFMYT